MSANLVLKDKAAVILLNEIHQDPVLKAQLELYFTPYCDCDIADWIVKRVELGDQFVIDTIVELIRYRDPYPIVRGGPQPLLGQLLKQYCNGNDFVGIYADGNGGEVQKTIEVNSESQGCKPPERLMIYSPYETYRDLVNAGADGVVFDDVYDPEMPDFLRAQKIFFSSPRTPRLQYKIGGLQDNDYSNISVHLFSGYDQNSNYVGNPSAKVPYNTVVTDFTVPISFTYDPNTRIVKLESTFSTTGGGYAYLTFVKNSKILNWIHVSQQRFEYDASSNTVVSFMTFIGNPNDQT